MRIILTLVGSACCSLAFAGTITTEVNQWAKSAHYYDLEFDSLGSTACFGATLGLACGAGGDDYWAGGAPYDVSYNSGTISADIGVAWTASYGGETMPSSVSILLKAGFETTAFGSTNATTSGFLAYSTAQGAPYASLCSGSASTVSLTSVGTQTDSVGPTWGNEHTFDVTLDLGTTGTLHINVGTPTYQIKEDALRNSFMEAQSSADVWCFLAVRPNI